VRCRVVPLCIRTNPPLSQILYSLRRSEKSKSLKGKGKAPAGPVVIDENTVYLEDLTGDAPKTPKTPSKKDDTSLPGPSPFSKSKNRWHDHDPYRLPEVNLEKRVAEATRSVVPDPRLATEEELRAFIEDMRPEDFDVTAPAFRELPTEVQYEIVGDLRLKSRQTSHKRLQNMLKKSRTPLDFSREQIKNLKQRNTLTQQLLITTDTIGQAHVSIPVRIASERNREYVLIKKMDGEGGWILGIRDDGSKENPIQIDQGPATFPEGEPGDSDLDMEEVAMFALPNVFFAPTLLSDRSIADLDSHHPTRTYMSSRDTWLWPVLANVGHRRKTRRRFRQSPKR
jgi:DNA excision repair protein ERCC-5